MNKKNKKEKLSSIAKNIINEIENYPEKPFYEIAYNHNLYD